MQKVVKLLSVIVYFSALLVWADEGSKDCQSAEYKLDKQFESGRFHDCQVLSDNQFTLTLQPENQPINPSPWYAFKVTKLGQGLSPITINIRYPEFRFRYWPKMSVDGKQWSSLPKSDVDVDVQQSQFSLRLKVTEATTWIAAQPLISNSDYQLWLQQLLQRDAKFVLKEIGESVQGRPISMLSMSSQVSYPTIVLLGRQHPPEITGAMAMRAFVERISANDPLSLQFRQQFNLLVMPNINPDGVAAGNWRYNANGIDLNRDWGPFTQPETQHIKRVIDDIAKVSEVWGMLDFHSTWYDVMYTQEDQQMQKLAGFVASWLQQLDAAKTDISFKRKSSHNTSKPTTKSYFFERFHTPSITFELGDDSDPRAIAEVATIAAELYMQNMLQQRAKVAQ
ncbi:M14 family metallopeptidase [Alteromonadaceae bacterium BrNp21-10]|nr:M14 family metallopeptidase [Alteromonadaceae bacterium BrNp21-10]